MSYTTQLLTVTVVLGAAAVASGNTYYVAADGADTAAGTSPQTAWRTLTRVNAAPLGPGDSVLFRRGDQWRGSIRAKSGGEGAPITYGAYGTGAKPRLLGSVAKNDPADWRDEGGGLWSTGHRPKPADTLPAEPPGALRPSWGLHTEGGAQATLSSGPAGLKVESRAAGKAGNHVQLSAVGLPLEAGHAYRLACRARCDQPMVLTTPSLMKAGAPWTGYSSSPPATRRRLSDAWQPLVQYYQADTTDANGRLTFYLGTDLPAGAVLEIDSLTFARVPVAELPQPDPSVLRGDVGNIIFDLGPHCGVKVWTREDLKADDQYWYDRAEQVVYLKAPANPATLHRSIELALKGHVIDEGGCSWVVYENLALWGGASHGIGGGSTHHIVARDLDISYIGGADQMGDGRRVRFGNGIEFWGNAHDNLVERCRIWEIYDAALTNQSSGADVVHHSIVYRDNVIWNAEFSFEYWNRPTTSRTAGIRFEHNTCWRAGGGWGHAQRPDPGGRHLCFYGTQAPASDFVVSDSIFAEATNNALYAPQWTAAQLAEVRLERNLWYQPEGNLVWAVGTYYPMAEFARYQAERHQDAGSLAAAPKFVDAAKRDLRLAPDSPGQGWGARPAAGD